MDKHADESLEMRPLPEPSNIAAKPHVRYLGFESIEGGRRLTFAVKAIGHESVEITTEISDAHFTRVSEISIQDAPLMAFEKIVELLATENTTESNKLCLTDADVAQYIRRHESSQKRASKRDRTPPSDVAA